MPHKLLKETSDKMDKAIEALQHEFAGVRTGRANAALLDVVHVEAYGTHMKINQLGTITVPDSHLLVVDLWDKSLIPAVEKAILASPIGITPSNDGQVIRIPMPQLSTERRKELVKVCAKELEEAKVAIRNIRRHAMDEIKKLQKDEHLPEDEAKKLQDEIQKLTDKHIARTDEIFKAKEADIMEI